MRWRKSEATADVILLNTCSVRDLAEQKALRKMDNLAAEMRRSRPNVVLGFMGCMAQSRGQELIDRLPDVDLVVGTQKFHRAAEYLDDILAGRRDKIVDVEAEAKSEATIREHLLNGNAPKIRHGLRQHHARLQPTLHLLHRARHARRGTQPQHSRHRCRMPRTRRPRRARKSRCSARLSPATARREIPVRRRQIGVSCNCSKPFMKSKDWNASGSLHHIRKATAMIWWKPMAACRSCAKARTFPCKAAATGC